MASPQTQLRLRKFATTLYQLMLVVFSNSLVYHHITGDLCQVSLTKKSVTFCWTDECQKAFDQLLCSAPVLAYPLFSPKHQFLVETDASVLGLGAILSQKQPNGHTHPNAYASRSLHTHEKNYGITELETLALVWAVKLLRPYLSDQETAVFTDHSACTSLLKAPHPSVKLARWAMAVQDLNLEIKHRSGKSNSNTDTLSRNPVDNGVGVVVLAVEADVAEEGQTAMASEVKQLQRDDADCKAMLAYLKVSYQRIVCWRER